MENKPVFCHNTKGDMVLLRVEKDSNNYQMFFTEFLPTKKEGVFKVRKTEVVVPKEELNKFVEVSNLLEVNTSNTPDTKEYFNSPNDIKEHNEKKSKTKISI